MSRNMKDLLDHQLSTLTWSEADSRVMMDKLKGEQPVVKRKISAALVLAVVTMLALTGMAVAAGFGAFSVFAGEENQTRLERLDDAAEAVDMSVSASAPAQAQDTPGGTLYDEIVAYQDDYDFMLTLDQAYSDGQKLYYAYTLRMNRAPQTTFGEGRPSGFDSWEIEHTDPADPEDNKLMRHVSMYDEAKDAAFRAWFDPREEAYAVSDYVGVGDGCRLADGRDCNIYDSGEAWTDETTLSGFQEVELPQDAVVDGRIDFVLSIGFGTAVYYQSEDGAYSTNVSLPWPQNIIRVPMSAAVTGSTRTMTGSFTGDGFTAEAELSVSDVEMFGAVTLTRTEQGAAMDGILSYDLIAADGTAMRNLDGAIKEIDAQTRRIHLRYDLPGGLDALALRPEGADAADSSMDIALQ